MKLTRTSKENLMVADSYAIEPFEGGPRCLVSVYCNVNIAFLQGDDEDAILFMSLGVARHCVLSARPDLAGHEVSK